MNKSSLHVAISNHKPVRDLPSTLPVAYYLHTKYGYDVTLFDKFGTSNFEQWARRIQPDVLVFPKIIDPHRFLQKNKQMDFAREYDPFCIVMPTEPEKDAKNPAPLNGVDLFLAWNTLHAEWAQEHHNVDEEHIEVVGCPRFDLFAEKNRLSVEEISETCIKYGLPPNWDGLVVTVASSFPNADYYLYDRSRLERKQKQSEKFGWRTDNEITRIAESHNKTRESFIELIHSLIKNNSDVWVILKTHPIESVKRYNETLNDLERVSIITNDYSARFLMTSDLHIHHDCTTGIEAFISGVPAINFIPHQYNELIGSNDGMGSLEASSISDILMRVEQIKNGEIEIPPDVQAAGKKHVENRLTAVDGKRSKTAARVVANYISEANITSRPFPSNIRTRIYEATSVDLYRESDESMSRYGKKVVRSLVRWVRRRPAHTGRLGEELPRLLSNDLGAEDLEEIEELLNLEN